MQRRGVWLPTRLQVSELLAVGDTYLQRDRFQANIHSVASISASVCLWGLPPGHTAASIQLSKHTCTSKHSSISVPPGSPTGSYSCKRLSSKFKNRTSLCKQCLLKPSEYSIALQVAILTALQALLILKEPANPYTTQILQKTLKLQRQSE